MLMTAPNCLDPIGGVIKLLLPDTPWSRPVSTAQEVDSMLRAAMDRNEEGLVFKDLASAWQKGDRSNNWMKMKPDYLPTDDLVCPGRSAVCVAVTVAHTRALRRTCLLSAGTWAPAPVAAARCVCATLAVARPVLMPPRPACPALRMAPGAGGVPTRRRRAQHVPQLLQGGHRLLGG